MVGGFEAIY